MDLSFSFGIGHNILAYTCFFFFYFDGFPSSSSILHFSPDDQHSLRSIECLLRPLRASIGGSFFPFSNNVSEAVPLRDRSALLSFFWVNMISSVFLATTGTRLTFLPNLDRNIFLL